MLITHELLWPTSNAVAGIAFVIAAGACSTSLHTTVWITFHLTTERGYQWSQFEATGPLAWLCTVFAGVSVCGPNENKLRRWLRGGRFAGLRKPRLLAYYSNMNAVRELHNSTTGTMLTCLSGLVLPAVYARIMQFHPSRHSCEMLILLCNMGH